jgi:hypothetical protein
MIFFAAKWDQHQRRPEAAAARRRHVERHCAGRQRLQATPQAFASAVLIRVPARPA